jgi:glycosyltransferase involved in cell wall biosynthesis
MEKAVQLTKKMNQMGQDTKLYLIGAITPKNTELSKNIILVKFLDKNKDIEEFNKILFNSHFHVLFSKSEAFGVVNCEASAYGLYTITHDIGGIEGAIFNNKNGFRFSKDHKMDEISKHIINIFKNQKKFIKNSYSSRNIYEKKLNWNIIGKKLNNIILKNI